MMLQGGTIQNFVHRENIARYQRILGTYLTAEERRFIERRLREEQTGLEQVAVQIRPVSESTYVT
jgi:hypothetical protein